MNDLENTEVALRLDDFVVERPADRYVVIAIVVAAVLVDLAVRSGVCGVGGALTTVAIAILVLISGRLENPQARALAALAACFGVWLGVRASPWLLVPDLFVSGGLLMVAGSVARRGNVFDLKVPDLLMRTAHAIGHGLAGPAFAWRPMVQHRRGKSRFARSSAVLRGAFIAAPLMVVLGALLASADAVFAAVFRIDINVDGAVVHALLLAIGAWGMAGLLRLASAKPPDAPSDPRRPLGPVEATVVLVALDMLFAAFAVARIVAVTGGADHVLETAGLTYAEYARSGFFQLLWVATFTLGSLLALRATADLSDARARRRFVVLAEVAIVLTLVIVGTALRRLDIYEHVFGLTMLRLYAEVFAMWIAVVFALLAMRQGGIGGHRAWFSGAVAATGLVALLVLNAVNPEAVVARHNITRAARGERFDAMYLAGLSEDAIPTLARAVPRLRPQQGEQVRNAICAVDHDRTRYRGWAAYSRSREEAEAARRRVCAD